MAARYWVGNGGNWNSTTKWSESDGGPSGASVPTLADDVYFSTNSFSLTNQQVLIGVPAECDSMSWNAGIIASTFITLNSTLTVYGNITFGSAIADFDGSGTLAIIGTGTLDLGGTSGNGFVRFRVNDVTSVVTLGDNLTAFKLWITSGTFSAGTHSVMNCNQFLLDGGTVNMGSGTWQIVNAAPDIDSGTLNHQTASLSIYLSASSQSVTFDSNGEEFGAVTIQGAGTGNLLTIADAPTFASLTISGAAKTIKFGEGVITRSVGPITTSATSGQHLLRSTTDGVAWTLSSDGAIAITDVDVMDSTAAGASAPFTATESTDSGNNTLWNFYSGNFASVCGVPAADIAAINAVPIANVATINTV